MSYEQYRYVFLIFAVLCGVFLLVSVILFFAFRIPKIVGDLTGSNARKAIERIRTENEQSGDKTYKVSAVNRERGKVTDRISPSGTLQESAPSFATGIETEKIDAGEETTVLSRAGTEDYDSGQAGDTAILSAPPLEEDGSFLVEQEIIFIHSEEIIA